MDLNVIITYSTNNNKWHISNLGVTYSASTLNELIPQIRAEIKCQADELISALAAISQKVEAL